MSVINPIDHGGRMDEYREDQLTAPGETPKRLRSQFTGCTAIAIVTDIDTNVVVKIEGSLNGTNWYDASAEETITANGSHAVEQTKGSVYSRFAFVSEAGGAAAKIKPRLLFRK